MVEEAVRPGDTIAGRYRVGAVLGQGGMGVVVLATDGQLGREVAIKFLLTTRLDDESFHRFLREARSTAQIASEHAVRVYDWGRTDRGEPFIVMESLRGEDLSAKLKRDGALPVVEVADVGIQACLGLAAAHAGGIIHRDIKPGNLFLEERTDGTHQLKILDFGLAKPMSSGPMTASNRLMGSPTYMSPEQISTPSEVGPRTDVWSLGVVLYEALTGERPFRGETVIAVCADVMNRDPTPPSELVPEIPRALDEVVLRCISRDPEQRFVDVAELAEALCPFASPAFLAAGARVRRVLDTPPKPIPIGNSDPGSNPASGSIKGWTTTRGSRRVPLIGWVLGGAVVVALLVFLFGGPSTSQSADVAGPTSQSAEVAGATSVDLPVVVESATVHSGLGTSQDAAELQGGVAGADGNGETSLEASTKPTQGAKPTEPAEPSVSATAPPPKRAPKSVPRRPRPAKDEPDLYDSRY